jgi:glutamine amidotransferase
MNREKIVIIDYGVGNTYSVSRALEQCGAMHVIISDNPDDIKNADKLILPGVGAFEDGMNGLITRNLLEPIAQYVQGGGALLGICLGMQLLATNSEEFGNHTGLGLIPGSVSKLSESKKSGYLRKVPYIGWSKLEKNHNNDSDFLINGDSCKRYYYFVHSFEFIPHYEINTLAVYDNSGESVTAIVRGGNVYGFQFHPEKSGQAGLDLLGKFLSL